MNKDGEEWKTSSKDEAESLRASRCTQTSFGLSGPAIYWAAIFETVTVHFTGKQKNTIKQGE